jgi:hypothetical protein
MKSLTTLVALFYTRRKVAEELSSSVMNCFMGSIPPIIL